MTPQEEYVVISYNDLKPTLKMYSKNIDVNLFHNGWIQVGDCEIGGVKLKDQAVTMAKAHEIKNAKVCYRRRMGGWGIPYLTIYCKSKARKK